MRESMTEKMKSKEKCVKGEADGGQQEAVCRSCIDCGSTNCNRHQAAYPEFCVSQGLEEDIIEEASALYHAEEINEKIAYASASMSRISTVRRPGWRRRLSLQNALERKKLELPPVSD